GASDHGRPVGRGGRPRRPSRAWQTSCHRKPRRRARARRSRKERVVSWKMRHLQRLPHAAWRAASIASTSRSACGNPSSLNVISRLPVEYTAELQSLTNLVCRLLLEKKQTTHALTPPKTHYTPGSSSP